MREFVLTDAQEAALRAQGVDLPAWVHTQLLAQGFDLGKKVRMRYSPALGGTQLFQYHGDVTGALSDADRRTDWDSSLCSDAEWQDALDALEATLAPGEAVPPSTPLSQKA